MKIQERKRYNFVMLVLYIVFFFVYGGLGLWMYVDGSGPFQGLPPVLSAAASVVVPGLMGGWMVAGFVGGIWLVCRFIGKQRRWVLVVACVFFFLTFYTFALVGFIFAIPFAIYNAVLIRRDRDRRLGGGNQSYEDQTAEIQINGNQPVERYPFGYSPSEIARDKNSPHDSNL